MPKKKKEANSKAYPRDYSTEELRFIAGDFEEQWKAYDKGDAVKNPILGTVSAGLQEWLAEIGYIVQRPTGEWAVCVYQTNGKSTIPLWLRQTAVEEIQSRRRYAREQQHFGDNGGERCEEGADPRCTICWPLSGREVLAKHGLSLAADRMEVPGDAVGEPDPELDKVRADLDALPAVDDEVDMKDIPF